MRDPIPVTTASGMCEIHCEERFNLSCFKDCSNKILQGD